MSNPLEGIGGGRAAMPVAGNAERPQRLVGADGKNSTANDEEERKKLNEACRGFESFFLQYMLKEMRNTVPESGLLGGGGAEGIYTSMMDSHLAQKMADSGGIGLAKIFEQSLEGRLSSIGEGKKR